MATNGTGSDRKYAAIGCLLDSTTIIVSILDLATDIIIMAQWYAEDRMVFFYIGLVILILAQLSYVAVFYFNHGEKYNPLHSLLSLFCTLPFTPCLSIIFYAVSSDDSCLRHFVDDYLLCFNFDWNRNYIDTAAPPQQQFLEQKLYKNLGFLLEAICEAFPMSILQLTFIVFYDAPSVMAILSILISMTSVCTKFLLLTATIIERKSWTLKLFMWICFVVDFFAVFWIVSFAFYTPNSLEYASYFTDFRTVMVWECIICIAPFAVIGSVGIHIYWDMKFASDFYVDSCASFMCGLIYMVFVYLYSLYCPRNFRCHIQSVYRIIAIHCHIQVVVVLFITVCWMIGLFATLLTMTIFNTVWCGFTIFFLGSTTRMPYTKVDRRFFEEQFEWILNGPKAVVDPEDNEVVLTKQQVKHLCVDMLGSLASLRDF